MHGVVVGARRERGGGARTPGDGANGGAVTVGRARGERPRGRVEVGRDVYFDGSVVETDGEGGGGGGVGRGLEDGEGVT